MTTTTDRGSLNCLAPSGRTGRASMALPEPPFRAWLPKEIVTAIEAVEGATAAHSRAVHLVAYAIDEIAAARKADTDARVAAARSGAPDPGSANEDRVAEEIAKARRDEPVARALANDSYLRLVVAVRAIAGDLGSELARKAVGGTRRIADQLDQIERIAGERERVRMVLRWLNAIVADQRVPQVGERNAAARAGEYARAIAPLRTVLGDAGPELEVKRFPGNGAKRAVSAEDSATAGAVVSEESAAVA